MGAVGEAADWEEAVLGVAAAAAAEETAAAAEEEE